jgi:hypothetical protein
MPRSSDCKWGVMGGAVGVKEGKVVKRESSKLCTAVVTVVFHFMLSALVSSRIINFASPC